MDVQSSESRTESIHSESESTNISSESLLIRRLHFLFADGRSSSTDFTGSDLSLPFENDPPMGQANLDEHGATIQPTREALQAAAESLPKSLPINGAGMTALTRHLLCDIVPALNASSLSANYYGFVTGGATPAAAMADIIASTSDQNVSLHLPNETIATLVEDRALVYLLQLFGLDQEAWKGRTFTTGATASNIMGLALGREHIINTVLNLRAPDSGSVGSLGILQACALAGIGSIKILTTMPHSSIRKAASIVGLGRSSVTDVGRTDCYSWQFDFDRLRQALEDCWRTNSGLVERSIVVVSCGEVNTGRFATSSFEDMALIRRLCDKYGAWLHVDAAFGLFATTLDRGPEFDIVKAGCQGLQFADSITGDAHKILNVPYDCGFFFSRHPNLSVEVFQNSNAAYLCSGPAASTGILSPLNIGIENSRRFRALPVYSTLLAYGRNAYAGMLTRQVRLARAVAKLIIDHPDYELLPITGESDENMISNTFIIVIFRARDERLNKELIARVNRTSKIYVSGTTWEGRSASRIAVANWRVNVEKDLRIIREVLQFAVDDFRSSHQS